MQSKATKKQQQKESISMDEIYKHQVTCKCKTKNEMKQVEKKSYVDV